MTGAGLDDLRAALDEVAAAVTPRRADFPTRLYVDRVFTLRGIGTVVTGTLWSGEIAEDDRLRLEPAGRDVRVRSVQVHDTAVASARAGQRVAVSLPGVERREVRRGDALVAPGAFPRSYRLEVALEELAPIADGARLTVHHGTRRIPARVVRVGDSHAQLRLAAPVVAARGDRVVLRDGTTVGGAVVLDPAPPRRVDVERDRLLGADDPASIVRALVDAPVSVEALAARALLDGPALEEGLDAVRVVDGWAFSEEWLEATAAEVEERLRAHAEASPLDPGLASSELLPAEPWAPVILGLLPVERRGSKLVLPGTAATLGARADAAAELERELAAAGLAVSKVDDGELARFLEGEGRSFGSETASRSPPVPTSLPATSSSRSAAPPARSRSRASATSPASVGATRSFSWNGWTPTASPAASATAASCDGRPGSTALNQSCENRVYSDRGGSDGRKSDFTEQEWEDLRKGATGAGLLVSVSDRSFFDTFKEASSLAKHVKGARDSDSQLVRELSAEGGTGFGMIASPNEVQGGTFESLEASVATLQAKAPDELESYRAFVLELAESVGKAAGGGDRRRPRRSRRSSPRSGSAKARRPRLPGLAKGYPPRRSGMGPVAQQVFKTCAVV